MSQTLMRIAFFLSTFPSTSETFVLHQIAGAMQAGHQVDIYAYQLPQQMVHPLVQSYHMMAHVHYRPTVPQHKIRRVCKALSLMLHMSHKPAAWRLMKMAPGIKLREWFELWFQAYPLRHCPEYNVIHAHFGPNGLMAVRLRQAGFLHGKVVTSFHGFDVNVVPRLLGRDYYRVLFEQGDVFVVSSNFIRKRLLQLGCPENKIQRIPVGVDVRKWALPAASKKHGVFCMLSVGRLVEVKGFSYAIEAVKRLKESIPAIRYDIVGDGPLREALQAQVESLQLQDCVFFHGAKRQDELVALYQQADIFVMPSVKAEDGAEEGQGIALLEAQAAGLPVVATKSGGIPESVPDDVDLVEEKNPKALADAIIKQYMKIQQGVRENTKGRSFVQQHFDMYSLNDQLLRLYERLC